MKATITTTKKRIENSNDFRYSVRVDFGDAHVIYMVKEGDTETMTARVGYAEAKVIARYNHDKRTFESIAGSMDVSDLNDLLVRFDGLPIIYAEGEEGGVMAYTHPIAGTEDELPTVLSVFVTNLGRYNEGALVGDWLPLPATDDRIKLALKVAGIDGKRYEEYFLTDYESEIDGWEIGEYENLYELNRMARKVAELDEYEREALSALLSGGYDNMQGCLEVIEGDDYRSYCASTMEEVAEMIIDETGLLDNLPSNISCYFDFRSYGRDLELEGSFWRGDGIIVEVIK